MKFTLSINGQNLPIDAEPDMPLLWVLRDLLQLTGTKFGCGIGQCGTCTVHVDGQAVKACLIPVSAIGARHITTIEGLAGTTLHPVQQAWLNQDVPQCGYCQSGQIMAAAALLANNPSPSDADIDAAMDGVLCRCGTYLRIRRAIHEAAGHPADTTGQT
jgi:aerobic-type carbon monoxide dehydrogenase small subunit (CoxS/CutS family)